MKNISLFKIPLIVLLGIGAYFILHNSFILLAIIAIGSFDLLKDTVQSILKRQFALDYIALLAITVGLLTGQYLVAAVIVLMLSGGHTLEAYASTRARQSLTSLTSRIPQHVHIFEKDHLGEKAGLTHIVVGQMIAVLKGEVIPLDGTLESDAGFIDESSLTGEPYLVKKVKGDTLRSGTVNLGDILVINVTKVDKDSTYRRIINLVKNAQEQKPPLVRLADRYSTFFTIITLILAALAYFVSHEFTRVLAVLVIATPCPLILATPIALIGGVSRAARERIIIKRLASLEVLSKVDTVVFDKTGTITLGKPQVTRVKVIDKSYKPLEVLTIAEAIERHSLHPLAKAVSSYCHEGKCPIKYATNIKENIGKGIIGNVEGKTYTLTQLHDHDAMAIQLLEGKKQIAIFEFEDTIKEDSDEIIRHLKQLGLQIFIFTGDKKETAEKVVENLKEHISVRANMSPEDKKDAVADLKRDRHIVAMIGDGINDAPALALADVGIVFSNEEQTAATEAADIVFLGGDFALVTKVIAIAKGTIRIALQSIGFGIGASIVGMILAVFGYIPALTGAILQEIIDVTVIFNALRSSR